MGTRIFPGVWRGEREKEAENKRQSTANAEVEREVPGVEGRLFPRVPDRRKEQLRFACLRRVGDVERPKLE